MSVDKFGRYIGAASSGPSLRGPPGEGFKRTTDGDCDMQNRMLRNVAAPMAKGDAVNLDTVENKCNTLEEIVSLRNKTMIEERFDLHNQRVMEEVKKAHDTVVLVVESLLDFQRKRNSALGKLNPEHDALMIFRDRPISKSEATKWKKNFISLEEEFQKTKITLHNLLEWKIQAENRLDEIELKFRFGRTA